MKQLYAKSTSLIWKIIYNLSHKEKAENSWMKEQ